MKPDPGSILAAAAAIGAEPRSCVLIGDSLTDLTAARAAGVPIIGYANKAPKRHLFDDAAADAVVSRMADVAAALLHAGGHESGE
jgi:phosphoglycolate phosphatase-like HAD superfamily hydrolase